MSNGIDPPTLPGCSVLPPMDLPDDSSRRQAGRAEQRNAKQTRSPNCRKTADRFRVLNMFGDFTLRDLSRAEIAVWLLLWRDTKPDGLACTSQADLARRAGIAPKTTGRAVASLRRRGLLTVVFRGSLRRGPSKYRVHPLVSQ